jgi:exosome complex component CSL4
MMVNDLADVKSGDIVVPGDQLCVIEELFPSMGTYELDGVVYAATAGSVEMDLKKRTIRVVDQEGRMRIALPQEGDEIVGEATNVYDQRAEISVIKINGENVHSPLVGEIHISNVTRRYVKSMRNVVNQGDIVRAHALNTHEIPIELSLVGKEYGVLFSRCVKCGYPLTLTTRNNMICLRCENRETREVTEDYGEKFGLEKRPELAPRRKSYDRRGRDSRRRGSDRRSRRR